MNKLQLPQIPANPRRIVLLNPTKYLGNLLLAGRLIQDFATLFRQQDREFLLVLDAAFAELCAPALAGIRVLWYPRQAIRRARPWQQLRLFVGCLAQIRAFRADLAFNIEEDSLSSRLTQFSAARYRLGCSPQRQHFGYDGVLPLVHGLRRRWYDYQAVFSTLGLPESSTPAYMKLEELQSSERYIQKLGELGIRPGMRLVAIHPAASKDYKRWPESAFRELCNILINNDFIPVLIGAGQAEVARCEGLASAVNGKALNLCNKLSLAELAGLLRLCRAMAGNDSGPSHLASALALPGVVVFGPSDPGIWGPLGPYSQVLRKAELCDPGCSRRACHVDYRCLREISPQEVFAALSMQISAKESQ